MILDPANRPAWSRYVIALAVVALAAALRAGLLGSLGTRAAFITFYPAVILAALLGGLPGGLLATVLSVLTANFFWVEPVGQFSIKDPADWLAAGVFVISCTMISFVTQAMQRARARAAESEAQFRLVEERNRAKEALDESEENYSRLFNSIDEGFCVIERVEGAASEPLDFRYVEANPAFSTQSGLNGVIGKTIRQAVPGEIEEWLNTCETVLRTGEPIRFELNKQGHVLENYAFRVEDGTNRRVAVLFTDITARKRTEQALRESEERLRLAQDAAGIGTFEWNIRTGVNTWTPKLEQLYGLPIGAFARTQPAWEDLVHPDDRAGAVDWVKRAFETGAPTEGQWRVVWPDGSVHWLSGCWQVFKDAGGTPLRMTGVNIDITQRRQAEEALRESEAQFRTLANAIPQLCWMANGDGWIFWYNERWYQYTGTTPEQMKGWGWQSVHDPAVLPGVLDRWHASIATGEPFDMVFPLRGADGVFRPFLTRMMPVRDRDGKVARWFGTNTDISEQRRIEEALATSESRLSALLESASQGVVAVDENGRILLVNARTEELFGYSRDELIGQPLEFLVPEHLQAAHARHQRQYFASPRTRQRGAGLDLRGRKKDGGDVSIEISLNYEEEGGRRLALALITDVTERKQAEEGLRQTQKLESLGLLAGGVAHDFNNLLVGVIGNASLAQAMLPPDHPAAALLGGVLKTGEQAAHLTRQMLAYSGKGKFLVEPLNLSALIPDLCGLVRPSIPKKIALQLALEEGLPAIEADRGQVQQVFMNLALNAAEAIGSEGVITVRTGVQDVDEGFMRLHPELAALAPGRYVCLEVRDTGSGMDEATKARIFDPFFSTKFTGRGLGLAAVYGILRGHKSGIIVSSAPGKGTCFKVLFPATTRAAEKGPVVSRDASLHGTGTVLVVDDEQVVRELAKATLEHHGYTVLVADSGSAAIDIFRRHPGEIALVILDLSMPIMSGEEALPELKKIRPEVKVLVSSGYSELEAMPLFAGQQVSGFIQKPYTLKGIAEKVKECLG